MRTLLIFLALCACASAQPFAPLQYHRTASAPAAFKPSDLDSLKFWVAADSITGKSAGDTVGIWRDLSPSKVNAVQTTAASKPIYYADSLGGKPSLYFDGVDDLMGTLGTVLNNTTLSAFIVIKRRTKSAGIAGMMIVRSDTANVCDYGQWNNHNAILFCDSSAGKILSFRGANGQAWNAGVASAYGEAAVLSTVYTGSVVTIWKNGVAGTTEASTGAFRSSRVEIATRYDFPCTGYNVNWNGHIAEVIVYSTALSDADRGKVETYLKTKYGL